MLRRPESNCDLINKWIMRKIWDESLESDTQDLPTYEIFTFPPSQKQNQMQFPLFDINSGKADFNPGPKWIKMSSEGLENSFDVISKQENSITELIWGVESHRKLRKFSLLALLGERLEEVTKNFLVLNQTQKVFLHKYLNFNTIFHSEAMKLSSWWRNPLKPQRKIFLCSFFSQLEAFAGRKEKIMKFPFHFLLSNSCRWQNIKM